MTDAERLLRNKVIEECVRAIFTADILQGDQYGHWYAPSTDGEQLAQVLRALSSPASKDAPQTGLPDKK